MMSLYIEPTIINLIFIVINALVMIVTIMTMLIQKHKIDNIECKLNKIKKQNIFIKNKLNKIKKQNILNERNELLYDLNELSQSILLCHNEIRDIKLKNNLINDSIEICDLQIHDLYSENKLINEKLNKCFDTMYIYDNHMHEMHVLCEECEKKYK
jgi:hypothetical protein